MVRPAHRLEPRVRGPVAALSAGNVRVWAPRHSGRSCCCARGGPPLPKRTVFLASSLVAETPGRRTLFKPEGAPPHRGCVSGRLGAPPPVGPFCAGSGAPRGASRPQGSSLPWGLLHPLLSNPGSDGKTHPPTSHPGEQTPSLFKTPPPAQKAGRGEGLFSPLAWGARGGVGMLPCILIQDGLFNSPSIR